MEKNSDNLSGNQRALVCCRKRRTNWLKKLLIFRLKVKTDLVSQTLWIYNLIEYTFGGRQLVLYLAFEDDEIPIIFIMFICCYE